ncbi:ATP-binding sensor histidine kinase [Archangium sp.]|jgi:predicted ATPase/signal transduction histidine kinase/tRNA A-37 threonylcarbamoyl transferase component Bud32|uniref:GAF domain-containing sensor histidine kinase n=1 Tax=Archangium sp. TaxID=1872627 RepID=UPI002ED93930
MPSTYTITHTLQRGGGTIIYRAVRDEDGRQVVIKALGPSRPRPRDLARLRNEHEIGSQLTTQSAVRLLALETIDAAPALVMEDFGGRSLDQLLGEPIQPGAFLRLAIAIAEAVAEVHEQHVIHKDLKPHNILVREEDGAIQIVDFGIATFLAREQHLPQNPRLIEGSLPYMSPEQTGRMNRALDYRTDLYSLGVTFYEMLTGVLPWLATDPLEWIFCHVAQVPASPSERIPGVPAQLSAIVMRLLAKVAEERYQTARGLAHDLRRCLESLEASGVIHPFPLAERDLPGRFQLPQKLYGRQAELEALLGAFERVAGTGSAELVLAVGAAGVGKSALIHALRRPIAERGGSFISGKFEPLGRNVPYATLVQAFQELVQEVLGQSEEKVSALQGRLTEVLGVNARLIVDVIPQVELLVGPQPPAPPLPLAEAQFRFQLVFQRFVSVFATAEHPLALYLDDLQWADPGSLELLRHLLGIRHLLVIASQRAEAVEASSPLHATLEGLRVAGTRVTAISLVPLGVEPLVELVSDTLHCERATAEPLARLLHEQTQGNPFFALQLLGNLQHEGLITFEPLRAGFAWDLERIRAWSSSGSVLDFLRAQLARLPSETQGALRVAACLGFRFDPEVVAKLHGTTRAEVERALFAASEAGLVLRAGREWRFEHDRVQQATLTLVPPEEQSALHLAMGRLLLTEPGSEGRLFEIVRHLNEGAARMSEPAEREALARLDLAAGRKAKDATAYRSALEYLTVGETLLPADAFASHYELAFALAFERAQCAWLAGSEDAAALFQRLLPAARTDTDRGAVHRLLVELHTSRVEGETAIAHGVQGLGLLGLELPAHPGPEQVTEAFQGVWRAMGERPIAALLELPPMVDASKQEALALLAAILSPALFTDEKLFLLVTCKMVELSIRHGNAGPSAMSYATLGMVLGPELGRYPEGFEFGKLASDLVDRMGMVSFRARIDVIFHGCISFWTHPLEDTVEPLLRSFDGGLASGDVPFACYGSTNAIAALVGVGAPLAIAAREAERRIAFVRRTGFGHMLDALVSYERLIRSLRGETARLGAFGGEDFDEAAFERHLVESGNPFALAFHSVAKLMARYLAGDFLEAEAAGRRAQAFLLACRGMLPVAEFETFQSLTLAALWDQAGEAERPVLRQRLEAHHQRLRTWAGVSPESFRDRAALLEAELARIEGAELAAMRAYEQAIRFARESGHVHLEAIACERAARFHGAHGFATSAQAYLREARDGFARWGADGKVRTLEAGHRELVEVRSAAHHTASVSLRAEQVDLLSVVKASQTISGEIVLADLVRTLIRIVLEAAGARAASLLLVGRAGLTIEAEATLGAEGVATRILQAVPVAEADTVPVSIVQYVFRTGERVLLENATEGHRFAADGYIERVRPRSVLCMPILRQSKTVGVLYVENELVAGAFTRDRLAVLELLSSQAAISLENALHLQEEQAARRAAEEALQARDVFLSVAAHELRTPLTPLQLQLETLVKRGAAAGGRGLAPGELLVSLERAVRQTKRLGRLVHELLDVARLTSRQLVLQLETFDLAEVVREVCERFTPEQQRRGSTLHVSTSGAAVGRWDPLRLEQVVTNLLDNAMKFGEGQPIDIEVTSSESSVRVAVRDRGIGIPEADAVRIFDKFERAVSERHFGGLGLGLWISRRIVEAHGGSMSVHSRPREGATFTVVLPLRGPGGLETGGDLPEG